LWVVKLDAVGNIVWQKSYGGAMGDGAASIRQTPDGGYIVAGYTWSFGAGSYDAWLLKLDGVGNVVWQRTYGTTGLDGIYDVKTTPDNGYIVAGSADWGGSGSSDAWVMKLDSAGNIVWQKLYGGSGVDEVESIEMTADGGYIAAGSTSSFGAGTFDAWVLKLDASGSVVWQKTYGGGREDYANSVRPTIDGGYIVAGTTNSPEIGLGAGWVFKLDASGNVVWAKTYRGSGYIRLGQLPPGGGYILAGSIQFGIEGQYHGLVLRLDANGNIVWQDAYGSTDYDMLFTVEPTSDGGYIAAGGSNSSGPGTSDAWVMKLNAQGSNSTCVTAETAIVTPVNSNATVRAGSAAVHVSNVVPVVTAAIPLNVSSIPVQWCPSRTSTNVEVPTLSEWAVKFLSAMLGLFGAMALLHSRLVRPESSRTTSAAREKLSDQADYR
jgi:hypothetical protein